MDSLKMKAKAGVTLVELLVVILIVTILSVSMLPLLQPFVTEAQYAAEAIPVIGNLRTKIGLYQYDKGRLPTYEGMTYTNVVQTWIEDDQDSEKFVPASYVLTSFGGSGSEVPTSSATPERWSSDDKAQHIGVKCDIDYQDLKGKRSRPTDYQYYVISAENNPSYVIACFGDGKGLKAGTGYAVCELNFTKAGKKYIGTWKRYKPTDDTTALMFNANNALDDSGRPIGCYIPNAENFENTVSSAEGSKGEPGIIKNMRAAGWDF